MTFIMTPSDQLIILYSLTILYLTTQHVGFPFILFCRNTLSFNYEDIFFYPEVFIYYYHHYYHHYYYYHYYYYYNYYYYYYY